MYDHEESFSCLVLISNNAGFEKCFVLFSERVFISLAFIFSLNS